MNATTKKTAAGVTTGIDAGTSQDRKPIRLEGPTEFNEVLWDELILLGRADASTPAPDLEAIYSFIGQKPAENALSAICLSGGGIRSATFNLGVLQAIAKFGLLGRFDYLSSVSGGGFIAGWLKAWMHRTSMNEVTEALADPAELPGFRPLAPEPKPIDHLRDFSNYLTPRIGLISSDTWAAGALIIRNLLLNWLVLLPVLTAAVLWPQVSLVVASGPIPGALLSWLSLALSFVFGLQSSIAIHVLRYRPKPRATANWIVGLGVLPLFFACMFLSLSELWFGRQGKLALMIVCAIWSILIPLAGWVIAMIRYRDQVLPVSKQWEFIALLISGIACCIVLFVIERTAIHDLREQYPPLFVVFSSPILLGLYLLGRTLFVAFASLGENRRDREDRGNADREWWGRVSGWILLLSVGWMVISALVILGGFYFEKFTGQAAAAAGGTLGLITALLGASAKTLGKSDDKSEPSWLTKERALSLLAPATIGLLVIVLAKLSGSVATYFISLVLKPQDTEAVSSAFHLKTLDTHYTPPEFLNLPEVILILASVPFALAVLSFLLGFVVNVNRYSLHGFYRNRLVRAYLGASNSNRDPDPFTAFDLKDDLRLHELLKSGVDPKPFPIINTSLNLVRGAERLAWQQRKAESFSMSPLYCGNFHEGYRDSRNYGGVDGVSLGTAMTISGAAASPNSGYHSSPVVTFLMTLFNVRLGCWLGNTNIYGEKTYRLAGPKHAWRSLFSDLLGVTDSRHPYVNLTDGGHFENLGAYEMILRRCRFILISDAGCDPKSDFEDLGNLIRKVRIDFGIPIEFDRKITILPREPESGQGTACALAWIRYDLVDPQASKGQLLYIKPTLRAARPLPYDVVSYSRQEDSFPHESTEDQWFSESQFESYRALGQQLAESLAPPNVFESVEGFFKAAEQSLGPIPDLPSPQ